ncbi:biotin/lipoyl-containing protein [Streptomyces sp. NPDC004647]|uniref:acetyl-CoA carboxylase biotin carboxyl carrier protein n=1 Tax=Streptomyces sp. NPDC004647 TaxID=3154671 RepID=UPI0033A6A562
MTLDTHKTNHQENGHRPAFTGNGFGGTDLAPLARADLESVCRSALGLANAGPRPPLRIKLQHGHMTVEMEWPDQVAIGAAAQPEPALQQPARPPLDPSPTQENGLRYVLSPTVGTFYHAPEPGAPPFLSVGDVVRPGQPIGILEVMKMMSTVEADTAGRVVEFLAPDAHPVEFQQRLVALEPLPEAEG